MKLLNLMENFKMSKVSSIFHYDKWKRKGTIPIDKTQTVVPFRVFLIHNFKIEVSFKSIRSLHNLQNIFESTFFFCHLKFYIRWKQSMLTLLKYVFEKILMPFFKYLSFMLLFYCWYAHTVICSKAIWMFLN